ncbi:hypothetical protein IT084_02660 [Desulfallas sp. Bu1-1]|uniref:hypothetical protein n=1 Tax=Desulfallas sp. Bu1-1 TaxID=2787620 RepID=UPI00189E93D4|nr:hypothetical protein [Desulfallas sp. Bu1-1]MBF7081876.1 hypothetical protein [Desulfallas sp. Bu1-1]
MSNEFKFRKKLMDLIQNHGPEAVLIAAKKAAQKEPSLSKAICRVEEALAKMRSSVNSKQRLAAAFLEFERAVYEMLLVIQAKGIACNKGRSDKIAQGNRAARG